MEQKYKKQLKEEIDKMTESLNQKLSSKEKVLENNFNQQYQKKQLEMQQKYNKYTNEIKKNIESNIVNLNNSAIKTIHNGIKCNHCFQEPIVGCRYKCSQCNDYNLCQDCEEKNSVTGNHPHDFIKLRKEENYYNKTILKTKNDNINNINNKNIHKEVYDDDDEDDFNIIKNENDEDNKYNNNNNNNNNINNNDNPNLYDNNNNYSKYKNNTFNLFNDDDMEDKKISDNNINNNNNYYNMNKNKNYSENFKINENNEDNKFDDYKKDEDDGHNLDKKIYSFECVKVDKITEVYEEQKDVSINITLKNNNKNLIWPKGKTKLVFKIDSELIGDEINLEPQRYNEQKTYKIKIKEIDEYPTGQYKCTLLFEVNEERYGEEINFQINIKEKN